MVNVQGTALGAAAVDWRDVGGSVAGLLLSLPSAKVKAAVLSTQLQNRIKASGAFSKVEILEEGRVGTSHDGFPILGGTVVELTPASTTSLATVRNRLYPALTGLDIQQFSELPQQPSESSNRFRFVFSTVVRPNGRALVLGGLATLDAYENLLGKARLRVADLASATLVGTFAATTSARCESFDFASPGLLDVLWVINGSSSATMQNARTRLLGGGGMFWNRAKDYSVSLRVGVIDMNQTKEVRLCNPSSVGPGRFFVMSQDDAELLDFQQCLLQPSGSKPSSQSAYGLQSAKNTLQSLLSRADGEPRKLRKNAQVAVVFASDVEAEGVADVFGGTVPDPLSPEDLTKVDAVVSPLANLLSTSPESQLLGTRAFALVIDPVLDDKGCIGRRGTGYIELLARLGRKHAKLCQSSPELDATLQRAFEELAPAASQLKLTHPAASSTITTTLNGAPVFRSPRRGFDHHPGENALLLHGLDDKLSSKNKLEVSYIGW